MSKMAGDILIGDLFRNAKIVSLADLTNAVQVSARTGLPVGRVLVMLELVSAEIVDAALHAQSLVRDRLLTMDVAVKALGLVVNHRLSLEQALKHLGELPESTVPTNRLGDLLLASELITNAQLVESLQMSRHLSLPLGRILILKGILSERQVESALEVQLLLRDEKISRTEALEALRAMKLSGSRIQDCLEDIGCHPLVTRRHTIRLGELLVLSELVSETDLLTSLEVGLASGQPIGQVLLAFGFIDNAILDTALHLQSMVTNGHLTAPQAAYALNLVSSHGMSLAQAVAEVAAPEVNHAEIFGLIELLKLAGLLSDDDCDTLLKFRNCGPIDRALVSAGLVNETTLAVAVRCQLLLCEGLLTPEQAIVALHYWRWSGISLTDILRQMGWMYPQTTYIAPSAVTQQQMQVHHSWY